MRSKLLLVVLVASVVVILSCHKSNSGGAGGPLPGTYQFSHIVWQRQSTNETSSAGTDEKQVSITNYTTTQNTGTFVFTRDSISLKGVSYAANSTVKVYDYENGALSDSFATPFTISSPVINETAKYNIIGTDSIHFEGGTLVSAGGSSGTTTPSGGHFSIRGDSLFIVSNVNYSAPPQSAGGVTTNSSLADIETIVLLKQ